MLRELTTAEEVRAHAREVARRRREGYKPPPKVIPIVESQPGPEPTPIVRPAPLLRDILVEVAVKHLVTVDALKGPTRTKLLYVPRAEFCYRAAAETNASYPMMGRILGGRDHTSIMHAVDRHCVINNLPHPRGKQVIRPHKRQTWTKEKECRLRGLYAAGVTYADMGQELGGYTKGAISSVVRRLGLPNRVRFFRADLFKDRVAELYAAGMTHKEIGRRCGLSKTTITYLVKRFDLPKRPSVRPRDERGRLLGGAA